MKKLRLQLILFLFTFTINCFGGNNLFLTLNYSLSNNFLPVDNDSAKKIAGSDSTKKDTAAEDSTSDNKRSYAIGLEYGSNQSYLGLHQNIPLPYFEPNFTYTAPSGFYTEISAQDILIKKGGGWDALDLNPGWNVDLADNTTLNINVAHFIFRDHTPLLLRSDISDMTETYVDQSIVETEAKFIVTYDYYKKSAAVRTPGDIILTPDLSHTFEITLNKKSSLSFEPEANIAFGTRNGDTHYEINNGDTALTRKGTLRQIPNNSSFGTLDYTLVFTINYSIGNFEVEPSINYADPLYKPEGIPTNSFLFFTVGLTYTIY
jgi:hypothetical protein